MRVEGGSSQLTNMETRKTCFPHDGLRRKANRDEKEKLRERERKQQKRTGGARERALCDCHGNSEFRLRWSGRACWWSRDGCWEDVIHDGREHAPLTAGRAVSHELRGPRSPRLHAPRWNKNGEKRV